MTQRQSTALALAPGQRQGLVKAPAAAAQLIAHTRMPMLTAPHTGRATTATATGTTATLAPQCPSPACPPPA